MAVSDRESEDMGYAAGVSLIEAACVHTDYVIDTKDKSRSELSEDARAMYLQTGDADGNITSMAFVKPRDIGRIVLSGMVALEQMLPEGDDRKKVLRRFFADFPKAS